MTVHTNRETERRFRIESVRARVVTRSDLALVESRLKRRIAMSVRAGMTTTAAIAAAAVALAG